MKINYIWLVIIIIIIFMVNKHINNNEQQNVSNDKGDINKQTISPLKKTIRDAIIKLNELSPLKIKDLSTEDNPVRIVKGDSSVLNTPIKDEVVEIKKDFISPNPEGSTEFRFVDETPKTAWSTVNVSQHPKHYTSNFEDEKVDVSRFFNEEQFYHDNSSPQSKTHIPDRCIKNSLNEVICEFNNKLQLIPPRLIEDPNNNLVLNSIGNKNEDIYQSINSFDISEVNGNAYQVWNYKDEKYINGGLYFNNVVGSSPNNESFLRIDSIKKDYSF